MPFTLFSHNNIVAMADITARVAQGKRSFESQAPLTLGIENGASFAFPIDPVVSVQGKSIITRRNVAKGGTMVLGETRSRKDAKAKDGVDGGME